MLYTKPEAQYRVLCESQISGMHVRILEICTHRPPQHILCIIRKSRRHSILDLPHFKIKHPA